MECAVVLSRQHPLGIDTALPDERRDQVDEKSRIDEAFATAEEALQLLFRELEVGRHLPRTHAGLPRQDRSGSPGDFFDEGVVTSPMQHWGWQARRCGRLVTLHERSWNIRANQLRKRRPLVRTIERLLAWFIHSGREANCR